jgi:hypothetical protein
MYAFGVPRARACLTRLFGVPLFMGGQYTTSRAVVQSAGQAVQLKAQLAWRGAPANATRLCGGNTSAYFPR